MIKKIWASLVCLVMGTGLLAAQAAKPYSYTFSKTGGDCLFTGKTYDEVWEAAASALVMMKYSVSVAQKETGMITAVKGPSTGNVLLLGFLARERSLNLIIKKRDNGICVLGNCRGAKKRVLPLYEHMAKLLYAN